jgi:hypothetical protein
MHPDSRIYIAGHRGLVGSAIHRELLRQGYRNLLTRTRQQLDLLDKPAVDGFFTAEKPDYVFLAAARVGGILANSTYPADFIRSLHKCSASTQRYAITKAATRPAKRLELRSSLECSVIARDQDPSTSFACRVSRV